MDPIQIIITIAVCIGALIALYFVIALILLAVGVRQAKRFADDNEFFGRPGRNFRR